MFYSASGVRTAQRQRSTRFVFTLPMMLPSSQGRLSPTKLPVMTLFWKGEATWKEGIKDRRYFFAGPIGTHGSGGVKAKYGGYVIYGNMIMLCEGANAAHSLDRCGALLAAMGADPLE
ncbi:MAG: hypothetical protein CM1200mP39_09860 [Dehalococcoidia bacterium]|nr:MAG: hypothetical protein CM1200mP39_09860 [Dehalococcoidia bacterium]